MRSPGPLPFDAARPNAIDFLRLALAVLVLVSHGFPLVDGLAPEGWPDLRRDPLHRLTGGQMFLGGFAVCMFFALSGFLVTRSWTRSAGLADFALRRAARIGPGFAVTCLVCALVVGPLGAEDPRAYLAALPDHLPRFLLRVATLQMLELPPTFTTNPQPLQVNGSLWSLWYEALCYATVPLLAAVGALRRRGIVLALLLVATVIFALQREGGVPIVPELAWGIRRPFLWLDLWRYFLAGAALFLFRDQLPRGRAPDALAVGALVASALLGGWQLVLPFAGTWLLLRLAFAPAPGWIRDWGRRHGDLSYGVYLYGFPVQQLVVHFVPGIGTLLLDLVALPITLALAAASWFLVERPALRGVRARRWDRSAS